MLKNTIVFSIALIIFVVSVFSVKANQSPEWCTGLTVKGDHASYSEGWHQIWNGGLLWGSDDVYTTDYGYLQCFCSPEGQGIETKWVKDSEGSESGVQWNLGDYNYNPTNSEYYCGEATPTPTATPFVHQACNTSCVTDQECRDRDGSYICHLGQCRLEEAPERQECNPRPTSTEEPKGVITIEALKALPAGVK